MDLEGVYQNFFGVGLLKCHFKSRCTSRKISSLQSTLMHTPCRFFLSGTSTASNLRSLPRSPSVSIFMESHHVSHKSQANTIHHISHQVVVLILHDPKLIFSGRNNCCTVDVFSIVPSQAKHIWKKEAKKSSGFLVYKRPRRASLLPISVLV